MRQPLFAGVHYSMTVGAQQDQVVDVRLASFCWKRADGLGVVTVDDVCRVQPVFRAEVEIATDAKQSLVLGKCASLCVFYQLPIPFA